MAVIDTLKSRAALEPDHRVASQDMIRGVLDMIEAAARFDMNEVRKVIAELREEAPLLAESIVADGPGKVEPIMATPGQMARRDELRAKTGKTPAEVEEFEALEKLGDPDAPAPLTPEGVARRDALRLNRARTAAENEELAKLEAAGGPREPLSLIETTRRDALRVMPNRSPAIEAELAALEARSEPLAPVMPRRMVEPSVAGLSGAESERRRELRNMTRKRTADEQAELDALNKKATA